ncbi:MAG: anti-sigma factor antagonist [Hormoscilla sp. GM7CHS1pb]|nr:anti-sigma factor antagonist [Hormoscilla sp. GM7CHS1pb]
MEIDIKTVEGIKVVELSGEVDASTAPEVQKQILPLAEPGSKILMDMTQVQYMSSAGLRMLLSMYRQTQGKEGKLVLVGLSEELQDRMSVVTGFLEFFTVSDTVDAGLTALKS